MPRIPTPLTWKRRNFAVFEPLGMIDRLYAGAVPGLVSGPFAIYNSPHGRGFVLIHLPSQAKIIDLDMQNACKDAAAKFAALWTSTGGPASLKRSSGRTSKRCGTSTSA